MNCHELKTIFQVMLAINDLLDSMLSDGPCKAGLTQPKGICMCLVETQEYMQIKLRNYK